MTEGLVNNATSRGPRPFVIWDNLKIESTSPLWPLQNTPHLFFLRFLFQ